MINSLKVNQIKKYKNCESASKTVTMDAYKILQNSVS